MKKILFALAFVGITFSAGAVSAQADGCTFSTPAVADPACSVEVLPVTLNPSQPQTVAAPTAPAAKTQLPVTGVETATIAAFGAAMVAGGVLLVTRSRRTESKVS